MLEFAHENGMPGKKAHVVNHHSHVMPCSEMLGNRILCGDVGIQELTKPSSLLRCEV
jgi:hypothetical protein